MEYESWANDWLTGLKEKVGYFRDMIKNTKNENRVQYLASTRERLNEALNKKYDLSAPESVSAWATEIMHQVEAACRDLKQAIGPASDWELPHTREAHQCGVNLVAEIGNGIREFKTLTERK